MANAPSKNVKSVTRWTPNPSPAGDDNLSDYLYSELNRLSDTLINIDLNRIEETHTDPASSDGKPRSGDIRYADGTNWNPLGEGKGLYIYDGSAWKNLVNQDISSITISSGNSITIQSGGSVTVQSGGSLTVDSGATITNNGTDSGFGVEQVYFKAFRSGGYFYTSDNAWQASPIGSDNGSGWAGSIEFDSHSGFDQVNRKWICPTGCAGKYLVGFGIDTNNNGNNNTQEQWIPYVNGTAVAETFPGHNQWSDKGQTYKGESSGSQVVELAEGDELQWWYIVDYGGTGSLRLEGCVQWGFRIGT